MRPILYPYKMGSKSAKALSRALADLRCKRVRGNGNYRPFRNHLIVNWGNSMQPLWLAHNPFVQWMNDPVCVLTASNKLHAFTALQEDNVSIPEFTTDRMYAVDNWMANGIPFFVRTTLTGHSGAGMYYIPEGCDALEDLYGRIYVRYIKKAAEYRVHVFQRNVITVQQKRLRRDVEPDELTSKIRSHARGWVFTIQDVHPPQLVIDNAIAAIDALGLDFGAVDVIWNEHYQRAYVLEVNTAPGLEGSTLDAYATAIRLRANMGTTVRTPRNIPR